MKKWVLFLLVIVVVTVYFLCRSSCPYIESGETQEFEVGVDSKVQFTLYVNGSTGYSNCWLNERECKNLIFKERKYKSSWAEITGSNGAGGSEMWTIKAIQPGIDTLIIAKCPTARDQKDCSEYSDGLGKMRIIVKVLNR